MPLLLFPQQHAVRESWEYPVLKGAMPSCPAIMALKGDSYTTTLDRRRHSWQPGSLQALC